MNLSAPFIHRPVMTTLMTLSIIIIGIIAFLKLPVTDLPSVEKPIIEVTTSYKGANSLTILNQVTIPLEKELLNVSGVQEMTSQSSPGISQISLSFDLSKNMDEATRAVQLSLNRAENKLPQEIDRPTYQLLEGGNESILYILLTSSVAKKNEMEEYAESLIIPQLSLIEGVANVRTFGISNSLWLKLKPEIMAARQIGFNQVMDTLKQYLTEKPLGSIQSSHKTLFIELSALEPDEKTLENLVITGSTIKLKEIGEISRQSKQEKEVFFISQKEKALGIVFGIQKIRGSNTVTIAKNVENTIEALQKELPSSLNLEVWFNKAIWIEDSILDLENSIIFALLLVVLVIYLSLGRLTEAIIPSIALPLSILGTLGLMYFADFSLDILSLLALTLSVGFVVDDAIVVLENIVRYREKGESALKASLKGSKQMGFTILAMTLSLVAVFIPLLFLGGMNGKLFREFSITIALSILVSGFISLSLTPFLCSRFLKTPSKKTQIETFTHSLTNYCIELYAKLLQKCIKYPLPIFLIALLSLASLFLFSKLTVKLVPEEDRGFITASIHLPTGMDSKEIKVLQENLRSLFLSNQSVDNFLNIQLDGKLLFLMRLKNERKEQTIVIKELQKTLNAIPGIQSSLYGYQMINFDFDLGNGGRYKYIVQGHTFQELDRTLDEWMEKLRKIPEFETVKLNDNYDTTKLEVKINKSLADHYGFTKKQIQELIGQAYGKGAIGIIQKGKHKTEIFMDSLGDLSKLYLTTKEGAFLPLKMVTSWKEKMGSNTLNHLDHLPSRTINFSLKEGVSSLTGIKKMEEIANKNQIKGRFSGVAKTILSNQNEMFLLLITACLAMYVVLGVLYESFIHPLTILSSLPFAGIGGILTLYLFHEPLSLFSAVGFLLLIGIVKKNGIMMIDYALEMKKNGHPSEIAIYEGCLTRFRPIMMTTFAAVMGAIPLVLGPKSTQGLGLVIIGGLLFSQILTLFITPLLFLFFEKIRIRLKGSITLYQR